MKPLKLSQATEQDWTDVDSNDELEPEYQGLSYKKFRQFN